MKDILPILQSNDSKEKDESFLREKKNFLFFIIKNMEIFLKKKHAYD